MSYTNYAIGLIISLTVFVVGWYTLYESKKVNLKLPQAKKDDREKSHCMKIPAVRTLNLYLPY